MAKIDSCTISRPGFTFKSCSENVNLLIQDSGGVEKLVILRHKPNENEVMKKDHLQREADRDEGM